MRTYDCRSRTPCFLASRVSPLIVANEGANPGGAEGAFGYTIPKNVLKNTLQRNRSSISETEIRKRHG
jgi:hypothetical protein